MAGQGLLDADPLLKRSDAPLKPGVVLVLHSGWLAVLGSGL